MNLAGHLHGNEGSRLEDPCVVQARNELEEALLLAHALVHLHATAQQAGREEVLVILAKERHRSNLGETCLHEPNGLERGRRAEDCDGVAVADVRRVDCKVAV